MAYQHKIDSGSLFPERTKEKETSRDYSGSGRVECAHCKMYTDVWISGWVNEGQNGKYLGLRFNAKDEQSAATQIVTGNEDMLQSASVKTPKPAATPDDLDEDVPF